MQKMEWIISTAPAILQVLLVSAMLRGPWRKYPLLFVLCVIDLLNSVIGAAATFEGGKWPKELALIYWAMEGVQHAVIFACLIHLLWRHIEDKQNRTRLAYMVAAAALFAVVSTWQAYHPKPNMWMTQLERNLSFGSMFVNLSLWTLLVRRPDRQVLMITAGLGFRLAGTAIGHSLRQMSRDLVLAGNLILIATYALSLFTLWRAMCLPEAERERNAMPQPPPSPNDAPRIGPGPLLKYSPPESPLRD